VLGGLGRLLSSSILRTFFSLSLSLLSLRGDLCQVWREEKPFGQPEKDTDEHRS